VSSAVLLKKHPLDPMATLTAEVSRVLGQRAAGPAFVVSFE
jgi:hypothetical protein